MPQRVASHVIALLTCAACGTTIAAQTPEPVVEWIKAHAVELKTAEPESGFADLAPLREMIGDARIVGLGEATHGTRETFKMKHRLFEYLVEEMGFTIFGIEASMPDCIAINDYVLHGEGDPAAALNGQGFWTWDTEEVLDLVKWMRAYNADEAHEKKLRFYGYDMQAGAPAIYHAARYLKRVVPEPMAAIEKRIPLLTSGGYMSSFNDLTEPQRAEMENALDDLIGLFDSQKDALLESSSEREWAFMRRQAVVATQFAEMVRSMSENMPGAGIDETQRLAMSIGATANDLFQYLDMTDFAFAEQVQPFLADFMGQDADSIILRYRDELDDRGRDEWFGMAKSIVGHLQNQSDVLIARSNAMAHGEAMRLANDLVAFIDICEDIQELPQRPPNVRDRCMAENIAWILEQEGPDAKVAVWAHNGHVQHMPAPPGTASMGNELERTFGDDYTVIGFSFNRGEFQAIYRPADGKWDGKPALRPHRVGNAKFDSFDIACAETGLPLFMLDVRDAPDPSEPGVMGEVGAWFARPHSLRMIGAIFGPHLEQNSYAPVIIADHYDIMIFMYETTAARPNPATKRNFGIEE